MTHLRQTNPPFIDFSKICVSCDHSLRHRFRLKTHKGCLEGILCDKIVPPTQLPVHLAIEHAVVIANTRPVLGGTGNHALVWSTALYALFVVGVGRDPYRPDYGHLHLCAECLSSPDDSPTIRCIVEPDLIALWKAANQALDETPYEQKYQALLHFLDHRFDPLVMESTLHFLQSPANESCQGNEHLQSPIRDYQTALIQQERVRKSRRMEIVFNPHIVQYLTISSFYRALTTFDPANTITHSLDLMTLAARERSVQQPRRAVSLNRNRASSTSQHGVRLT